MIEYKKKISKVLHQLHPIKFRIITTTPDRSTMHKRLFIEILDQLKK